MIKKIFYIIGLFLFSVISLIILSAGTLVTTWKLYPTKLTILVVFGMLMWHAVFERKKVENEKKEAKG